MGTPEQLQRQRRLAEPSIENLPEVRALDYLTLSPPPPFILKAVGA